MAEAMTESPDGQRRACDQCRSRKIRCDKDKRLPCSNCRTAKRECSSTGLGQKPREVRQRVMVSNQYERKIDHLAARLTGIEEKLGKITTYLIHGGNESLSLPSLSTNKIPGNTVSVPMNGYRSTASNAGNDQTFEGGSSMSAQAISAGEFLEQVVTMTPLSQQKSPDVQAALASLRQMVHVHTRNGLSQETMFVNQRPLPKGGIAKLPMPPVDVVLHLLREIQAGTPMTFITSCSFITIDYFIECCQKVFFAIENFSLAVFVIVNAGLYYLFQEKSIAEPQNESFLSFHHLCRDNLDIALASWPLLQHPNREIIEALLLGATYSIEVSKFTIAYQLNSTAAAMCQTLGWHRLEGDENEASDAKLSIFWFCYMLDKVLSLRYGRNSIIQDWDISTPRRFGNIHLTTAWKDMLNAWIQTGSVLGEAYEKLYSPSAITQTPSQQTQSAQAMIQKLKQQWKVLENVSTLIKRETSIPEETHAEEESPQQRYAMSLEVILKSGQVSHLASLTLIYRAIPNAPGFDSTLNFECIEAARMAFRCHADCMQLTSENRYSTLGYLHWTILCAPFTPLTVLFCHVIETSNREDLEIIGRFAASFQPVLSISPAIDRFQRLCKVLHHVAEVYMGAKEQGQQDQDMYAAGNDFDMYFLQLGILSQSQPFEGMESGISGSELRETNVAPVNQAQQLEDWFSGNRSIMSMMEEEFLDFDSGDWPSSTVPQ
ncbi:hypothetical protein BGZ63DRAFT_61582 [Mariannaea sp. PMI_226]|nr:hypothetical protein BGZ63DRAFT_61582 [Mariannaea sp. PMI_226]